MTDKSQEQALALLKEAKENGTLDKSIEAELADLIGTEARPELEEVIETPVTAESAEAENLNPELTVYSQEYNQLSDNVKARASWEAIAERLLDNDSEKLKLVKAMQGEGQLVGVDSEGKALFKDKGVEPVMYGYDKKGNLLKIYDRNPEQMEKVERWANYFEIREQVLEDGYELFTDDGDYGFGDEMKQATDHTKEPFIASEDRNECRVSWLESGDKPDLARIIQFQFGAAGGGIVVKSDPGGNGHVFYGAVRLLRI